MKLSESEGRCVAKWERQERSWHWVRWLFLVFCVVAIILAAWNLYRLLGVMLELTKDRVFAGAIAWFAPFAWLALLAPSAWLGYILGRWRGDIKTRLLLRLIAEHEDEGN